METAPLRSNSINQRVKAKSISTTR